MGGVAYSVCSVNAAKEPNNWLLSDYILVEEYQRLDITVTYTFNAECSDQSLTHCKEFFAGYVMESNISGDILHIPSPLRNASLYEKISTFRLQFLKTKTTSTTPFIVKTKFIVLAFHDQGACILLHSVKVSYRVCSEETLSGTLVSLPQTVAPLNESLLVEGRCAVNSVQIVQESLSVLCESTGEWNTSRLEGRCICKENKENNGGKCEGIRPL